MRGRVAAIVGERTLELQEYEVGPPQAGGAVLRVRRANVCGSDVHIYHYRNPNFREAVLGHEFVGEIAEVGAGLETDSAGAPVGVGDRVVVVYFQACGRCVACGRGDLSMCAHSLEHLTRSPRTAPHFHGAFATHFVLTPRHSFYRVPDEVTDAEVAGANCGLAQVLFSLDGIGVGRGQDVVVQGAGGLGLYACAAADAAGARVIVVEGEPSRIEAARRFGAAEVVDMAVDRTGQARVERVLALTDGVGADRVLEVTGQAAAFTEAVGFARTGGRIASVGNLNVGEGNEVSLAPALLTRRNLRVRGFLRYDPWYLKRAVDFVARTRRRYPFASLTDRVYGLDDLEEAIARSESRRVARPAVVPAPATVPG